MHKFYILLKILISRIQMVQYFPAEATLCRIWSLCKMERTTNDFVE